MPAPVRGEGPGAGKLWRFYSPSRRNISSSTFLGGGGKTVKNTNDCVKKNKTKSSQLKKKKKKAQPKRTKCDRGWGEAPGGLS